ncbi:MAG: hypothetical protein WCT12_35285, partial [Verrucomicrobiota bacterium]
MQLRSCKDNIVSIRLNRLNYRSCHETADNGRAPAQHAIARRIRDGNSVVSWRVALPSVVLLQSLHLVAALPERGDAQRGGFGPAE